LSVRWLIEPALAVQPSCRVLIRPICWFAIDVAMYAVDQLLQRSGLASLRKCLLRRSALNFVRVVPIPLVEFRQSAFARVRC